MKEHTQKPGVRKWAGDDMIALQAEPLSAIQGFFKEYGNCIIQGCATTPAAGGKFNVTPGLLGLSGRDADGVATFKVVPFSGVENVTLPLYFTLTHSIIDRVYGDGKVKPIAYDYRAAVSAVRPVAGVEFLELTTAGGRRFVDAVKITEKLDKTGNGRDVTVTFAQAATRENIASGEKLTVILGKIIRWLADLKALAFKDKVSKADMDAALQGELDGKEPGFTKNTAFNKNFGTAAGTVCQGNDARLSDARVASDVSAWAKANAKPAYTANEIGAASVSIYTAPGGSSVDTIPYNLSNLTAFHIPGMEYSGVITIQDFIGTHLQLKLKDYAGDVSVLFRGETTKSWKKLAFTSDIPASLPANGGNADTVGGSPAWRLQSVGEDLNTFGANMYNMQSRFNAKGDGRFRLEIVSADSSDHRDKVSVGHADVANNADTVGGKHTSDFLLKSGDQAMQGNLTLNTPNQSYVAFSRNGTKGYVGLIAGGYTHVFLSNEASGANLRADDNGKNYSNNKEIATIDQIKILSGGAAATAGQYVSGITVNDHAITVTKEALPTSDRGSVNNRDWNTILEPGSYNTSPQLWGTNNPAGVYQYGLLTVECSGNSVVQTYYESNYATMNCRVKSTGSSFSAWTQVAKKSDVPTTTAQLTEAANKKFVTDAEKTKIGGSLEILCAGRVSASGVVLSSKGCYFDATKLLMGGFSISHNQNNSNLIIMVTSDSGTTGSYFDVTNNDFKIYSFYINSASSTIVCGFSFIAYKI